jgi:hypothetical protein
LSGSPHRLRSRLRRSPAASGPSTQSLLLAATSVLLVAACSPENASAPQTPTQAPVDRSNIIALDQQVEAALLPAAQLPDWATTREDSTDRVGHHLQQACGARVPTDDRIVTDAGATWSGAADLPFIDEWVAAYDQPIAAEAVDEAQKALTCTTYSSRHGSVQIAGAFDVGAVQAGSRMFGFCEEVKGRSRTVGRCSLAIGTEDIACNLRVWHTAPRRRSGWR